MDIMISTSSEDAVDLAEVATAIERGGYFVNSITLADSGRRWSNPDGISA